MASSTSKPQILGMPDGLNPDTLDTIAELAVLLNRLRMPTSNTGSTPAAAAPTPAAPPSSTNKTQQQTNNGATTTTNTGELSLKEIPPAADVLKHRFQKARALIRSLPDVNRGVAEQEAEIAALETRLAKQRDMLARLREMGVQLAAQDDGDRMVVD
ncbi:hypothetical protein M426DRAFT_180708 [Hypoxylon sp. CI-4A]|nr:hypothetical protein M426DRAFT_180708 [Hypoxylon sp. CI-4A]